MATNCGALSPRAELTGRDKVLEIGPGLGPLTELLVAQAGGVLAIEKDARLVEVLREHFGAELRLQPAGCATTLPPEACNSRLVSASRRRAGVLAPQAARLARLEAGGEPALFRGLADSGRTGAVAQAPGADGRHAATGGGAPVDGRVRAARIMACSRCSSNSTTSRAIGSRFRQAVSSRSRTWIRPASCWRDGQSRCWRTHSAGHS